MSDWPIELSGMPDTAGDPLLERLKPATESALRLDPTLAVGGAAAVVAGAVAAVSGHVEFGAAAAVGGLLAGAGCVRHVQRPRRHRPMTEGYEAVTRWLAESPRADVRNHLYLGKIHGLPHDVPNLLSLDLLKHHLVCLGASGSSKTQRLVVATLLQLLRRPACSVLLLDAKGDRAAFHLLRRLCQRLGIRFTYFSLDPRIASHLYCMERDPAWLALDARERAQVRTRAFALEQSESGNEGFWSAKGRDPLIGSYQLQPDLPSSRALLARLADKAFRKQLGLTARDYDNASHLLSGLRHRAGIAQADPMPSDGIPASYFEHAVNLERLLTVGGELCYMLLSAQLDPVGCRFVGREALYTLTTRARTLPASGRPHTYVVMEEAPCIIQESIGLLLKQSRDTLVSFLLTFQNASDMKLKEQDLRDLLLTNTAVKVAFTMKDEATREYFQRLSGERRSMLEGETEAMSDTPTGQTVGSAHQWREVVVPRLGPDEFDEVNASQSLAVFDSSPNSGFSRLRHPVIVDLPFPVSEEEFRTCAALDWPEPMPGETIRGIDIRRPPAAPTPPPPAPSPPPPPATPTKTKSKAKKKHRRKPPTAEQLDQAADAAAYLRRVAGDL